MWGVVAVRTFASAGRNPDANAKMCARQPTPRLHFSLHLCRRRQHRKETQ